MPQQTLAQGKLILFLTVIIGFAAGYFYHTQAGSQEFVEPLPPGGASDFQKLKDLKVDFKLLEDQRYKALRVYGELPVNPGLHGKQDPFAP